MPPRRKAPTESLNKEQPKRRSTRLTTKPSASTKQEETKPDKKSSSKSARQAKPDGTKTSPIVPTTKNKTKSSIKPAKKTTSNSSAKKPTEEAEPSNSNSTPNAQNLTITSSHVKSPIQCQTYTPTSPSSPQHTLIFTHGAGGTLSAAGVVHFCTGYSSSHCVLAFQGTMNLAARTAGFRACIEHLGSTQSKGEREKNAAVSAVVVLGGRSMGARAAVLAGAEILDKQKQKLDKQKQKDKHTQLHLVLASYPLVGPKAHLRDAILLALPAEARVLFVSGDKDTMCPLNLLEEVRGKMKAKSQLVVVKGADHGMNVKPARQTREFGEETGRLTAQWVDGRMEDEVMYVGNDG